MRIEEPGSVEIEKRQIFLFLLCDFWYIRENFWSILRFASNRAISLLVARTEFI